MESDFGESDFEGKMIRTSRWSYFVYYVMIVVILFLVVFIKVNGLVLQRMVFIAAVVFCLLIIKATEVHRFSHYYRITSHGLEKVEGIFIRRHKKINYGSISQMHLTTTPISKLLGIGSIEIAQFSENIRTEIKNINKPKEFLKEVSERMHRR